MDAVQRLKAAIEKLETLKAESTRGPWVIRQDSPSMDGLNWSLRTGGTAGIRITAHEYGFTQNADLIVTLHRAIDAQLALLRAGALWLDEFERRTPAYSDGRPMDSLRLFKGLPWGRAVLDLADAILGAGVL